jgi:hypothetical protein
MIVSTDWGLALPNRSPRLTARWDHRQAFHVWPVPPACLPGAVDANNEAAVFIIRARACAHDQFAPFFELVFGWPPALHSRHGGIGPH